MSGCSIDCYFNSSLANIFCDLFESEIIEPEIENGTLKTYFKYVDDMICIIRKNQKYSLLDKLNNFNPYLNCPMDSMQNVELVHIDTKIINSDCNLHLEMYKKRHSSENLLNYKNAVSPKCYTISTLVGKLYRCNYTTSTPKSIR
jgi:hypothetical protein